MSPTVTYWDQSCPHCKKGIGRTFDNGATRPGPGKQTCGYCQTVFADGSIEWPQLNEVQKHEFLNRGWLLLIVLFSFAPPALFVLGLGDPRISFAQALVLPLGVLDFGAILFAFHRLIAWSQIRQSRRRYTSRR
jgi:hypothetical protein